MTRSVSELLRLFDDPRALGALAPTLTIGGSIATTPSPPPLASAADDVRAEGYAVLPRVIDASTCAALARGAADLTAAGIPALFLVAFDELWSATFVTARAVSESLGIEVVAIPDLWAWYQAPAPGARGWGPHRGVYEPIVGEDGLPTLVNAWIPLLDVTSENGCMVVVPKDLDPGFPTSARIADTPLDRARAVPADAGSIVFWGANVLHWGGTIGRRAAAPRVAFSVSLRRPHAAPDALRSAPTFRERIELLATIILTYEANDPTLGPVLEWARALVGMSLARRKLRPSPPTT